MRCIPMNCKLYEYVTLTLLSYALDEDVKESLQW